jgi:hypothetical protein
MTRLINNSLENPSFSNVHALLLYPNPTKGILNISVIDAATRFRIFSTTGQEVLSRKFLEQKVAFPIWLRAFVLLK